MLGAFIVAIALLAAMLYLIVRPFIWTPRPSSADVAHEAIPAPEYASVAATSTIVADAAATYVAVPVTDTGSAPEATAETTVVEATDAVPTPEVATEQAAPVVTTGSAPGTDDVRLRVEALIASRKAELSAAKCPGCATPVATNDAFCRSCGTKLT